MDRWPYVLVAVGVLAVGLVLHCVIRCVDEPADGRPRCRSLGWLLLLAVLPFSGCFTMSHTVGGGPRTGDTVSEKRWYALYGLVPLSAGADSAELAGGAKDYCVTTEFTTTDVLVTALTSFGTLYRQTVTVER